MKKVIWSFLFLVLPTLASAQVYEYAAKFVCGRSGGGEPANFAPGTYYTSINVHSDVRTSFVKIIAVSLPSEKAGGRTREIPVALDADTSMQVDCTNIFVHLRQNGIGGPAPADGFVVFRSRTELDVVGVYTAYGAGNLVSTMHMDRVPARVRR